jgi:hypothetical protein
MEKVVSILESVFNRLNAHIHMKKPAPLKLLGKILFPGQARWQQKSNLAMVFWAVGVGVLTGGAIAAVMVLHSSVGVQ